MNARQKAKKYKKENEFLKNNLFRPRRVIIKTEDNEHLRAQCVISKDFIDRLEASEVDEYVRATLSAKLAYYMGPKLIVREETMPSYLNVKCTTDIWVGYGKEERSY